MEALSVRNYRNNLASSFTRAEQGESVLIRRKNQLFALISLGRENSIISPELQQRIDEARKSYHNNECIRVNNKEELNNFLDQL